MRANLRRRRYRCCCRCRRRIRGAGRCRDWPALGIRSPINRFYVGDPACLIKPHCHRLRFHVLASQKWSHHRHQPFLVWSRSRISIDPRLIARQTPADLTRRPDARFHIGFCVSGSDAIHLRLRSLSARCRTTRQKSRHHHHAAHRLCIHVRI